MKYLRVGVYFVLCILCACQLYQTLYDFVTGEKWTNSNTQMETNALEMPEVVVCNYNRVDRLRAIDLGITEKLLQEYVTRAGVQDVAQELKTKIDVLTLEDHFYATVFASYLNAYGTPSGMLAQFSPHMSNMTLGRVLYAEFMKDHRQFDGINELMAALAISCNRTALDCRFEAAVVDCCKNSRQIATEYGMCFTVRSTPNVGNWSYQRTGGVNGLQMYLNSNLDRHISAPVNNWMEQGFSLYINYQPERPSFKFFAVPIGYHTFMTMHRTEEITTESTGLNMYAKHCTDQKLTLLNHSYSSDSCLVGCALAPVMSKCNCLPYEYHRGGDIRICEPEDMFACVMPKVRYIWELPEAPLAEKMAIYDMIKSCQETCTSPCIHVDLDVSMSGVKMPADSVVDKSLKLMHMFGSRITKDAFKNGLAMVDIYFSRLVYTVVETYPKITFEQLIGNVGGILGVYIGISVFSLFEAADGIVAKRRKTIKSKLTKSKKTKIENCDSNEIAGRPPTTSTLYD